MDQFVRKLERMQQTQDRHLIRTGRHIRHIAKVAWPNRLMVQLADELRSREEAKLDPAARELASIMPPSFCHADRAIDCLIVLISVMATRVDEDSIGQIEEAVKAGFELVGIIDDLDFVDGLTDRGADVDALRVFAQFLCALKAWLLLTERLIERIATRPPCSPLGYRDAHFIRSTCIRPISPPANQSRPPEQHPPEGE